jgi:hypothetical protein
MICASFNNIGKVHLGRRQTSVIATALAVMLFVISGGHLSIHGPPSSGVPHRFPNMGDFNGPVNCSVTPFKHKHFQFSLYTSTTAEKPKLVKPFMKYFFFSVIQYITQGKNRYYCATSIYSKSQIEFFSYPPGRLNS